MRKNGTEIILDWLFDILREVYSDLVKNPTKSEFKQGHRHKMFNEKQIQEIKKLKSQGVSNVKIASMYNCSEKTIRNYLKNTSEC